MLTACYAERKDDVAAETVKQWEGQSIEVALGSLGPPDKTRVKNDKKAYFWHTERLENVRLLGGREIVRDGPTEQPNADHFNIEAPCDLILVTRVADGIITNFKLNGQILACTQLADKINTASPTKK
jgi:hypothetical protein